jgi:hypothetical protein
MWIRPQNAFGSSCMHHGTSSRLMPWMTPSGCTTVSGRVSNATPTRIHFPRPRRLGVLTGERHPRRLEVLTVCAGWKKLFTPELLADESVPAQVDAIVALVD